MTTTEDPVIEVTLTSRTTARTGEFTLEAGTATIQEAILSHARRRARALGRSVTLVVTAPNGRHWTHLVAPNKHPENDRWADPGPLPQPAPADQAAPSPDQPADSLENTRIRGWLSELRERMAYQGSLADHASTLWAHRGVRYTAAVAVLAAAVGGGAAVAGSTECAVMASNRPAETFSLAGPGDKTSGPGIIEASNYAYYVWPRTAAGVSVAWTPGAAGTIDALQKQIDKAAADKLQFRLAVTETSDPLVLDAQLTITTADGVEHPYAQRYHVTRNPDGTYLIASKTDCDKTCPPL